MDNVFEEIETDEKAPEALKKSLLSEVDLIRTAMEVVTLFLPSVFGVLGSAFTANIPPPANQQETQ